ncbi:MAG: GTP pyrophosphokinase family protein [Lachnospiraceae bacterium]|nr:GTP pyrophosphokinase family protein [Lachnospiraceae bacterium]
MDETIHGNINPTIFEHIPRMDRPELILANDPRFKQLLMLYECAIMQVNTKLQVLNNEFSHAFKRNPIESIKSRIKTPESIWEKLMRRNLPIDASAIERDLTDIAGIRVICPFQDDIYNIAELLISQDDVTLVEKKDYIKNPKPNGYRSLHLIIAIPIYLATGKKMMKVEVQLRTIAMDFWASLDHKLRYKQNIDNADEIVEELKECADIIAGVDLKMQDIRKKIH